jgi:peptidoglycan pentaglycine glycine transferase (the first glycine)
LAGELNKYILCQMNLRYIDPSLKNEWENLVKKNPASGYMQSFDWARFINFLGWETFKIGIFDKNELIGGAIVTKYSHFKNQNILYIPEGPVLPYEKPEAERMFQKLMGEIDNIADFTGEKLTSNISIEPKLTNVPSYFSRFKKAKLDRQPLRTIILNLKLSEKELLQQMEPKGRYNIKVAKRHNVEITQSSLPMAMDDFLNLYLPFTKRSRFEGKDISYFECFTNVYSNPNKAKIFLAKVNDEITSAAIVIYFGNTVSFLYGASSDKHREAMAPYLLHWEIMKDAKKQKYEFYDLYSITPNEDDTSHPWYGFTVFKKKFGGEIVKYIGAYDFIYNKKLYEEYLKEN